MLKVGITGQSLFIGTHLFNFLNLKKEKIITIPFKDSYFENEDQLRVFVTDCDAVVHLAAMNRHGDPQVIYDTNLKLVNQLIETLEVTNSHPHLLFSSSIQEERDNLYGKSKHDGRLLFEQWAVRNKARFTGFIIPNVFGPFGNPFYNSVVATFCHQLTHNEQPKIVIDANLQLIYVNELADLFYQKILGTVAGSNTNSFKVQYTSENKVSEILLMLETFKKVYFEGHCFPELNDRFEVNLFNTFRSYIDNSIRYPVQLKKNTDQRGTFIETIKTSLGGQFSFSTTLPGVTRGNHYHIRKIEIFFKDLELRKPDYFLEVDTISLEVSVGDIIRKSGEVLRKENPDAVLVLGDTNSCLAAYMAKRLHIPVFHMEAGNRCFDLNVPEEINRRIINHIADFNLIYTEHARRHLISEGLPHRRIYLTGSLMKEVLDYYMPKIKRSKALESLSLKAKSYFLVSTHREENVDNPEHLSKILNILNKLAIDYNLPVIVSTHPWTRKRLEKKTETEINPLIQFLKPFGFLDYVYLQINALCTISDSGTISEESAILNFPAISLRQSMERPEAQDAGTIVLTGFDPNIVVNCIQITMKEFEKTNGYKRIPDEYIIDNTSWRVLKLISGNAKLSNLWYGVK